MKYFPLYIAKIPMTKPMIITSIFLLNMGLACSLLAEDTISRNLIEAIQTDDIETLTDIISKFSSNEINIPTQSDGKTWFQVAASQKKDNVSTKVLEKLVKFGANPLLKDNQGRNALMSLNTTDERIITYLLSLGIDINDQDIHGNTALHYSIQNRYSDTGEILGTLLIKNKADINIENNSGVTPLLLAVKVGNRIAFERLLQSGADYLVTDNQKAGLLHYAVRSGDIAIIKKSIELDIDINAMDKVGFTAASYAAGSEKWSIVRYLLENGSNANVPTFKHGNLGLFLLENANYGLSHLINADELDPDLTYRNQATPLEKAVSQLEFDKIQKYLNIGADPNKIAFRTIASLCRADFQSKPDHLRLLKILLKHGLDINKTGSTRGDEPCLYYAIKSNNKSTVKLLLENNADPNLGMRDIKSWTGTPLGLAVIRERYSIAYTLLEAGARTDRNPLYHWEYLNHLFRTKGSQAELFLITLMEQKTLSDEKTLESDRVKTIYRNLLNSPNENISNAAINMRLIDKDTAEQLAINTDSPARIKPHHRVRKNLEKERSPAVIHNIDYSNDAQLHLIGIYEGNDPNDDGMPWWSKCQDRSSDRSAIDCHQKMTRRKRETFGEVDVHLGIGSHPVILALSAHNKVIWKINNSARRKIEGVILMGNHEQRVRGLQGNTSLFVHTKEPSECSNCLKGSGYFLAYKNTPENYTNIKNFLYQSTKKNVSSYQYKKKEKSFWIK